MKSIITTFLLCFTGLFAHADSGVLLQEKDWKITPVVASEVVLENLADDCQPGALCGLFGTRIVLNYGALACADRLGPVNYKVVSGKNKTLVYVSAHVINNQDSQVNFCFRAPIGRAEIVLPNQFNVEVIEADSVATSKTE
jgi:hypothetical protein